MWPSQISAKLDNVNIDLKILKTPFRTKPLTSNSSIKMGDHITSNKILQMGGAQFMNNAKAM